MDGSGNEVFRDAVRATRATGSARMRFLPGAQGVDLAKVAGDQLGKHGFGGLAASVSDWRERRIQGWERDGVSTLPGPDGSIDFARDMCLYASGPQRKLFAGTRFYVEHPAGGWEGGEADSISEDSPFWLLAVVGCATNGSELGVETVLGAVCTHFKGVSSFTDARSHGEERLAAPIVLADLDLVHMPVNLWLDSDGRIRRALAFEGATLTQIDLWGFGEPDPLVEPRANESG